MKSFGEVLTAMVTPFNDAMEVDYLQAAKLAEKLMKEGSDGIVVAGTTGESPTLTKEEKLRLFREVKAVAGAKGTVIAGTGSYCTASTVELSKEAEQAGVDGLLVVTPYYNKPPQEGLYGHFAQVAEAVSIPIILYNIPGRTGVNMSPELIERLHRDFPHINAVKDSTGNLEHVTEIAVRTRAVSGITKPAAGGAPSDDKEFRVFSGDDSLTLPLLACGGTGVISVAAHIAGRKIKEMIISFFEGRVREARDIHWALLPLFKGLFTTTNPILVKEALDVTGFRTGGLRPPMIRATAEQREKLIRAMKDAGVLQERS